MQEEEEENETKKERRDNTPGRTNEHQKGRILRKGEVSPMGNVEATEEGYLPMDMEKGLPRGEARSRRITREGSRGR